jgi:hypothetical protein
MKAQIVSDGKDIYVYCDGLCVAKRGRYNTPQAKTWITLVTGYTVTSPDDHSTITVEIDPGIIAKQ